jgi:hypothetical protein
VLFTTTAEPDWPDSLEPQTGVFTYYGDNRIPGRELHDTQRAGNLLLRDSFERGHDAERTPTCHQSFCVVGNDLRSVADDP